MIRLIGREEDFISEYERLRPELLRVIEHIPNRMSIADNERSIIEGIASHRFTMWTGERSIAITELCEQDNRKCLWFNYVAGNLSEIMDEGLPIVEEYAIANGCEVMMFQGRRGWDCKKIKQYDFKLIQVVLAKEIVGKLTQERNTDNED